LAFYKPKKKLYGYCNTGGFGIDGNMSSLIGASLVNKNVVYYGIFGDLSFFYDLNSLGNRHIGNNIRIMLINNGKGAVFRHNHERWNDFGNDADLYGAAAGHFGNKSRELVKNLATNLGFQYCSADDKKSFFTSLKIFFQIEMAAPIVFEVFTDSDKESEAYEILAHLTI
jgi:2-succinyl-5-enolpyruvyl-6-hydroxy-3-cyclohexene-1-carboxylate synthase